MKRVRTALLAGSVAACIFWPASSRSQPRHRRLQPEIQNSQLHNLIGLTVENHDGEKLGKIKNFAMERQSGEAKYALISSGGIAGVGAHLKIAPVSAISTATAKKAIASLDISKPRWAKAPLFKKNDLAMLNDPSRSAQIAKFYARSTLSNAPAATPSRQTGTGPTPAGSTAPLQLATDIVGKEIINQQEEAVGTVSDLLLDLAGQKPSFAIISTGHFSKTDQSFAVPLRALNRSAREKLRLDANRKMFEGAQTFDEKAWEAAGASNAGGIFRFEMGQ